PSAVGASGRLRGSGSRSTSPGRRSPTPRSPRTKRPCRDQPCRRDSPSAVAERDNATTAGATSKPNGQVPGTVPGTGPMRPAVVYGLLHAGLAIVRSLGRDDVPVEGIALHRYEFGLRSRYLRRRTLAADDDAVLEALRHAAAPGERPVLFLERDENVDTVLRRWDEVHELADVPLPEDPEPIRRLRRKDLLPEAAAEAGVPTPYTVRAESEEAIRDGGLKPPLLVKPLEGQEFALALGEKAVPAKTLDEAV